MSCDHTGHLDRYHSRSAHSVSTRIMLLLSVIITAVCIPWNIGAEYCSESKTEVNCVPCTECQGKNKTCYVCPINCYKQCQHVCHDFCLNGACEYIDDGSLKCSKGCVIGSTGLFCHAICPSGCMDLLCHQFNSSCISCKEGLTGDYCNETVFSTGASTISTISIASSAPVCRPPCVICKDQSIKCCTEDSGSACPPSGINSRFNAVPLVVGLVSALCFITVVMCIWYRLIKVYQMQCWCRKRSGPSRSSGERLSTVHEYDYIDENDLNSYNAHLKQESRKNGNQVRNQYQSIENIANQEAERESLDSTLSGSMFGNLFELNETHSLNRHNLSDNIRDVSFYDYGRYLSPTRPNDDTDSSFV